MTGEIESYIPDGGLIQTETPQQPALVESAPAEMEAEQIAPVVAAPKVQPQDELPYDPNSFQAHNFNKLRDYTKKLEEELRMRKQMEQLAMQQQQQQQPRKQDEIDEFDDEDYVKGNHLKSTKREIRELKEQLRTYEQRSYEIAMQAKHPDLNEVISPENLYALKQKHPIYWKTLEQIRDGVTQTEAAYQMIKDLGIHRPEDINTMAQNNRRITENVKKPKPASTIAPRDQSPLAQAYSYSAGDMSAEEAELRVKKMKEARARLGM